MSEKTIDPLVPIIVDPKALLSKWHEYERYGDKEVVDSLVGNLSEEDIEATMDAAYADAETLPNLNEHSRNDPTATWNNQDIISDRLVKYLEIANQEAWIVPLIKGWKKFQEHDQAMAEILSSGNCHPNERDVIDHTNLAENVNDITWQHLFSARESLLDDFSERPADDKIWSKAYDWVKEEGDTQNGEIASDIPAAALIAFAEQVRSEEDPIKRYALTAQKAPNGNSWFNVLESFSSPQIEEAKGKILEEIVRDVREGNKFNTALDLGTGIGKSLKTIEGVSEKVVGVDRVRELLDSAKLNKGENTYLVVGGVEHLSFSDHAFDLITSSGLAGALDADQARAFYQEISNLLTDEGIYIDGSYAPNAYGSLGPEATDLCRTSKAMLTDMIVDSVSGKYNKTDSLDEDNKRALLDELGLKEENFTIGDNGRAATAQDGVTLIRIVSRKHSL